MSFAFTNHFELATEGVNGAAEVAFGHDDDRLLTSAGALTIARHPEHGLVTGTTLGTTTETHEYSEFGEPSRQTALVGSTQVFDVQIQRDPLGRIAQGAKGILAGPQQRVLTNIPRPHIFALTYI